jgi:hypothetical protein
MGFNAGEYPTQVETHPAKALLSLRDCKPKTRLIPELFILNSVVFADWLKG